MENLQLAFWKASRGKRANPDQIMYQRNLNAELKHLRDGLASGDYPVGNYRRFEVSEPKRRLICAAAFCERVLHHALMNVCEPYFERWLVDDTYACRVGKGQVKAVERAMSFAHRYTWYLKCDVRKYFDSVSHEGISALLRRKFKDERMIWWFDRIVGTYEATPGCGLPIGNLTSQHLANLYLDSIDRFPRARAGYVRYMDDFVFWSNDKNGLLRIRDGLESCLRQLRLKLKPPVLNRVDKGMDFLGVRLRPNGLRATREGLARYKRKLRMCEMLFTEKVISEQCYQYRVTALTAPLLAVETGAWREKHFGDPARSVGLEPRETGWQLEQRSV